MAYNKNTKTFSAYSSLFNNVKGSMFIRDNVSNRVSVLFDDTLESNKEIANKERLRVQLFEEIKQRFNARKHKYDLLKYELDQTDGEKLEISRFILTDNRNGGISGYYRIFPRAFYCKKCGDFKVFHKDSEWLEFNPSKCHNPKCDGKYSQFPFVGFCEDCGKITDFYNVCPEHREKYLKLIQYDSTSPRTWKLKCTKCGWEEDFLAFCWHDEYGTKISKRPPTKFLPISIQQGSVSRSVVVTTIDIPKTISDYEYLEYIAYGLYMGKFDKLNDDLEDILYDLPLILNRIDLKDYELNKYSKVFRRMNPDYVKSFDNFLIELRNIYEMDNYSTMKEINDYLILKGFYTNKLIPDDEINKEKLLNVKSFKDLYSIDEKNTEYKLMKELKINDVYYIENLNLISSSIGTIKGLNKLFDGDFVPHFEPYYNKNGNLKVYSYPYETEALLIDLDKIKLVKWLIDNGFLNKEYPESEEKAKEILINLRFEGHKEAYEELSKLIHTFSHVLINSSAIYTGLQSDSCSELLLPSAGAFVIYSTSNIKIGGFLYVFENNLSDWFKNVKLDVNDCVFDPTCIDEAGACFSCVYLPEFVCCDFNRNLDRDVFIASTKRYKKGFWQ